MSGFNAMLADGTYDALVIDASDEGEAVLVELTIVAGEHKGEVVTLHARELQVDALELLGVPATLTVTNGAPSLLFEP